MWNSRKGTAPPPAGENAFWSVGQCSVKRTIRSRNAGTLACMDPRKWFPSSSLFRALLCVYCGGIADTSDHTPPRCLLPKPLPEGLKAMTVPACSRCNVGFSQDELRTAAVISTVSFLESDRLAVAPGGRIYEQMARNPKLGDFVSSRLGQDGIFQADLGVKSVIARVMTKTTAGLLFYEFGRIVPLSDISVLAMEHARNANPSALAEMYRRDDNGWAEVTPSGRMLERQALSFLGYTSPHMPKWRVDISAHHRRRAGGRSLLDIGRLCKDP